MNTNEPCGRTFAFLLVVALIAGCNSGNIDSSGEDGSANDASSDGNPNIENDPGGDMQDAGADPGTDSGTDSGNDPGADLGTDAGADPGTDADGDPGSCIPNCTNIPCGQQNSCNTGVCNAGSGCCDNTCTYVPCGTNNACNNPCPSGSGCCDNTCNNIPCGTANACLLICQAGSGCCNGSCAGIACGQPNACNTTCQPGSGCIDNCCAGVDCGATDKCGLGITCAGTERTNHGAQQRCDAGNGDCGCGNPSQSFYGSWQCTTDSSTPCKFNAGAMSSIFSCLGNKNVSVDESRNNNELCCDMQNLCRNYSGCSGQPCDSACSCT